MMLEIVDVAVRAPVRNTSDVLVVGAGPAGLAAAVASARLGVRTQLVERYGYVGGNLTAGLVGPCMTSYSLDGKEQLIRGIFEELILRLERVGAAIHPSRVPAGSAFSGFIVYGHDKVTPFDPEAMKAAGAQLCLEAGVDLLFHAMVVDALTVDKQVTGVVIASKSGLEVLKAGVIVDCSADGDVAARAGEVMDVGRADDGLTQPMTLFFRVGNVDDSVVERYVRDHPEDYRPFASIIEDARNAGEFTIPRRGLGIYKTLEAGVWRVNTTRVQKLSAIDVGDLTKAELEGRRQVTELMSLFRRRIPGFENAILVDTGATIGVRESRRIRGEYCLTLDDLATGREFDDVIALCGYPVDIHSPTDSGGGTDESNEAVRTANVYEIPYRSLVPATRDGLLVAGRCVSATHEALGAIRVMPPAFAMGQAAGTAAALAVKAGVQPRDIDVSELQRQLLADRVYLGPRLPISMAVAGKGAAST